MPGSRGTVECMQRTFVMTRVIATIVISTILAAALHQLIGDPRMSLFVFLAAIFFGYMFTMISVATREE